MERTITEQRIYSGDMASCKWMGKFEGLTKKYPDSWWEWIDKTTTEMRYCHEMCPWAGIHGDLNDQDRLGTVWEGEITSYSEIAQRPVGKLRKSWKKSTEECLNYMGIQAEREPDRGEWREPFYPWPHEGKINIKP